MALYLSFLLRLSFLLSVLRLAAGHGFVHNVVIGGLSYPGWNPFVDPYTDTPPRVVRKVLNDGYISIPDPDIACHHGGNNGTTAIASAPSGSQVIFQWAYWPGDHQGPVSTYMTSCNGDCSSFASNDAQWFKLDADGYDTNSRQWAAAKLIANNNSWSSTIPADLAPGQYLMRNEIIALQSSTPQFYPSCSQVEVTGSGINVPSDNELVSMQTLYQGVTFPNIYGDSVSFTIPGPTPVTFGGIGGNTAPSSTISTSPSTVAPASTKQPSDQCRLTSRRLQRQKTV